MHNSIKAALISMVVAGAGFAQEQAQAQQSESQNQPPLVTAPAPAVEAVSVERSIGVHTGLNLGVVQVDVQNGHFYGFLSSTLGVPLLSNGNVMIGNLGLGYSVLLSSGDGSAWYFDLYGHGMGGKMDLSGGMGSGGAYGAIGMGVGIRYLHRSGFTLGFKLPVFGMSVGDAVSSNGRFDGPTSLGLYYLGYLCSQAPLTLGFRF